MSRDALDEAVRKLEAELGETKDLDEELRTRLARVADEIDAALDADEPPDLGDRLSDLLLALEVEHPRLTSLLDAVTRQLSRLGI